MYKREKRRFLKRIGKAGVESWRFSPGSPMEQNRRRSPRYPFVRSIELREGTSDDKRMAPLTELSQRCCYLDTKSTYPLGPYIANTLLTDIPSFGPQPTATFINPNQC